MLSTRLWVLQGAAIILALAFAAPARAVLLLFTVDEIGVLDPSLTPIAPTAANIGKYNAGSFLALSGNISGTASGVSFSGALAAQKASSGAWSTGNPGSLTSYYTGGLLVDVNVKANVATAISFPGGSSINANNYTGLYPVKGGAAVPLSPAIGGGAIGTPGSDPANYGTSVKITALFGLVTVANGTASMRDTVLDVAQTVPLSSNTLTPVVSSTQNFTTKTNVSAQIDNSNFDFNLKGGVLAGSTVPDLVGRETISNTSAPITGAQLGTLKTGIIDQHRAIYQLWLTVPVTSTTTQTITGDIPVTINVTTTGQIAAYVNVQLPEPGSLVLAGFAAIPLGLMAWRRRKRGSAPRM
jgi:hypothetical protein